MRRPIYRIIQVLALALLTVARMPAAAEITAEGRDFFEAKIRPVLIAECYECHAGNKSKGGLLLDSRENLLQGGNTGDLIAPGDPEKTLLIQSLAHTHEDEDMRMPKNGAKLDKAILNDFIQWVKMGAPDPRDTVAAAETGPVGWDQVFALRKQWWAFQPLQKTPPVGVKLDPAAENPVDSFIHAKLAEHGLAPAGQADSRLLERRLAFALTGLPPQPSDLKDEPYTDKAWADRVEHYLGSPAFGETWARHWMDLVRYAESHGSEGDPEIPFAWRYRDYLVRAFNSDLPYDRFLKEHVAGDLMEPRWNDALGINESALATANLRLVEHGFQPVDSLDEQVKTVDNQIDVLTKSFLGLTVSCARCHDHKFDAISHKDYYALYGILSSTRPGQITLDKPEHLALHRDELVKLKAEIKDGLVEAWLKAADDLPKKLQESHKGAIPQKSDAETRLAALRGEVRALVLRSRGMQVADKSLPQPVSCWSFDGDARDNVGKLHGELNDGAVIHNGRLVLDGNDAYMRSAPFTDDLRAKTLEAWVALANTEQRGGGVLTVESEKGNIFDSIVFGEKAPREWVPGSNNFKRSRILKGPLEVAPPTELVHLTLVHGEDDTVSMYRNGVAYGESYKASESIPLYAAGVSHVLLGRRHTGGGQAFLAGEIEEARLYDRALSAVEVAASYRAGAVTVAEADLLAAMSPQQKQLFDKLTADLKKQQTQKTESIEDKTALAWRTALDAAAKDTTSPLHIWLKLRDRKGDSFTRTWEVLRKDWGDELAKRKKFNAEHFTTLWDVSSGADYSQWFKMGTGLPAKPSAAGEFAVSLDADTVVNAILPAGVFSDLLSSKHNAVLTSPRFKMDTDAMSFQLAGHAGGGVRVIPDNYPLGNNGTYPQFRPERDALQWTKLDTTYRKGANVYVELATYDDSTRPQRSTPPDKKKNPKDVPPSDGRSSFGVSKIVMHKDTQDAPQDEVLPLSVLMERTTPAGPEDVARNLVICLKEAVLDWEKGSMTAEQQSFLNYFVSRRLLPVTFKELPQVAVLTERYRKMEAAVPVPQRAPGALEADGHDAPLLVRGDHKKPDALVERAFLSVFGNTSCEGGGSGRKQLAEAMTHGDNPLVARVMVNRIWHWLFGRGLVPTVDNFGRLGEQPTHPELLDYLAGQFIKDGYSVKKMIRLMLTSQTWRMSSDPTAVAREKDPDNQWLSHFRVRRLDAEAIRDAMLVISGDLDPAMGGPSVPINNTPRRSVYLTVRRNSLSPFMSVFDTPKPFTTAGRRDVTNVPAQSLTMLNDPFVIRTSERWARRLLREQPDLDTAARMRMMFQQAFARTPDEADLQKASVYFTLLSQDKDSPPEAVWRDLAQSLFNLKEFIYLR